jgi:hypothetical protein
LLHQHLHAALGAIGAIAAAKYITLRKSVRVIPLGIAMGLIVLVMNFVESIWIAVPLLIIIGGLSGFFVVPMNALLQHRGHILMGAGHSIAVQNFNENISILIMTGLYYLMVKMDLSIYWWLPYSACLSWTDVFDPAAPSPISPTRRRSASGRRITLKPCSLTCSAHVLGRIQVFPGGTAYPQCLVNRKK